MLGRPKSIWSINLGILGHVDSGKTSIAKILSELGSTAAFDKCKQSQERGITIDLGFSCFTISDNLRVTLVDCPGHASLIRTVVCGAQIIDAVLLVIDVSKGIQAQTVECIQLAQIYAPRVILVMNKFDLLHGPDDKRTELFPKLVQKLEFEYVDGLYFSTKTDTNVHVDNLHSAITKLAEHLPAAVHEDSGPLLMVSDHCFALKGKGTVLTGTVLQGATRPGDKLSISSKGVDQVKKVKSIQSFRETVQVARKGDRVALLVQDLPAEGIERAIVSTPGHLQFTTRIVARVKKLPSFKGEFKSKSKIHCLILNTASVAQAEFFQGSSHLDYLLDECCAVMTFVKPIPFIVGANFLGAKLDIEPSRKTQRFVFSGTNLSNSPVQVQRSVTRFAMIDRAVSERELIGKDLVKTPNLLEKFIGHPIRVLNGNAVVSTGKVTSSFGTTGKFKVLLDVPMICGRPSEYTLALDHIKTSFL